MSAIFCGCGRYIPHLLHECECNKLILPDKIEKAIQREEAWLNESIAQKAGTIRLRTIRWAIEDYMKANNIKWDSQA